MQITYTGANAFTTESAHLEATALTVQLLLLPLQGCPSSLLCFCYARGSCLQSSMLGGVFPALRLQQLHLRSNRSFL
jgi:hypothetical protein